MGLARALCRLQPDRSIAVVKVAYSSTSITEWDPQPAKGGQTCYQTLIAETKLAIQQAKDKGLALHPRAFVWVQGESDATEKGASQYAANLGQIIQALRKDLGAPKLIALVGLNTAFSGGKNPFVPGSVEAQKKVAATAKYVEYVDSTGCDLANAGHFDSKGTLALGQRFTDRLLQTEARVKKE